MAEKSYMKELHFPKLGIKIEIKIDSDGYEYLI